MFSGELRVQLMEYCYTIRQLEQLANERNKFQAYLWTFICGTRNQTARYVAAEGGIFENVL
jgi:hypothetical protein